MCWSLTATMTPSSSSTTKCSCRGWKPTSCSMRLPGWDTFCQGLQPNYICTKSEVSEWLILYLLIFVVFFSRLLSLQSHKYRAAPTSSQTHLCECLGATTCTSLLWKTHACLRVSWRLAPGQSCMPWEIDRLLAKRNRWTDFFLCVCFYDCRMLVSIGESFGVSV